MNKGNVYLVFLRWPEKCFRASADDLKMFSSLVCGTVVEAKSEREFLKALPSATHVITWYFKREWYLLAKRLQSISTPAAGRELISLPPDPSIGVHFGHYHGEIMAESVVAFVMAWARGFLFRQPTIWPRVWLGDGRCFEVSGTNAVIFGYGHVGKAIGDKLSLMGINIYGISHHECDKFRKGVNERVDRMLSDCDWLILALPSDTGTDDLVDANFIRKLPKRCVIVNIGRGNAIDEKALSTALIKGKISGAYLDVLKYEPHYKRCADVNKRTMLTSSRFINRKVPNAIVMPHAAAFSRTYFKRCFKELQDDGII